MKKIVRGNDFKLRVPVMKIVDGAKVAFPLPGCTDIKVNIVNQYRRIALSYTIDVSEDNVLLARVEGDKVAVGTYALEVKGKIFGNDWRSNEYEQFQIVDNNASGDTVFEPQEGEDSVEMDTALVVLAPSVELGNLIKDAEETIADTKEALKGVETKMGDIEKRADTAIGAATTAAERANTAVKNAQTATSEAENVDATITDVNVLEVTGRDGVKKSLELVEQAEASEMKKDVARIKESIGAYSDRPNITLTAKENNVAISADGVKVSKNGWAIAEFTAEKGNEYLFKPNVVDGTVCIFAEKISSVETRSIDYTYSYNEDGTTASATATYLDKTHTYSYAYADGEDGTKSVTITDESGTVVTELPYQYKTTVGSYAPLVRLNARAELPEDGYCRFMSHFQGNASMTVAVSYKVGMADLTMKVLRDGVFASISTQLGNLSQKENETRSLAVELKEKMATLVDTNPYVGMVRMNGDASPDAEMTFGDKQLMHEVGAEWKLATVKNGVVTHVCAPGRLTLDENGEEFKIDGTDGDVMLINRNVNVINATKVIDGREMNCLAIGKTTAK